MGFEGPGKKANTVSKFSCQLSRISCRSERVIGWVGWSADVSGISMNFSDLVRCERFGCHESL